MKSRLGLTGRAWIPVLKQMSILLKSTKSQLQSMLKHAGQAISGNVPELARRLFGRSAVNSRPAAAPQLALADPSDQQSHQRCR